jgi:hypothetical protein
MSAIDAALLPLLERLPAQLADRACASTVLACVSDLARRLAVEAAFAERLAGELGGLIGCSHRGRLTRAGHALAALRLVEFERAESRLETVVRACALLGGASLHWHFAADTAVATLSLRWSPASSATAPHMLLRVQAARLAGTPPRVQVHRASLAALDRRHVRSGLDVAALCHALVGFLPELLDEEFEMHERVVEALLRLRRHGPARAARAAACRRWWIRRLWWRRDPWTALHARGGRHRSTGGLPAAARAQEDHAERGNLW